MRDSFVFYRSFYEAIRDLPRDIQGEAYTAIMEYALNGECRTDNLKPVAKTVFTLVKPLLDANTARYVNGCKGAEFGKLGGRPRKNNPKQTPRKPLNNPKQTPNEHDNVHVNENENESLSRACAREDSLFELFWSAYPNKRGGKECAKKAFLKLKPSQELTERMIQAVEVSKQSAQWQENNGRFIPHAKTWLNQKRWEDEPMPKYNPSPPKGKPNDRRYDEDERARREQQAEIERLGLSSGHDQSGDARNGGETPSGDI